MKNNGTRINRGAEMLLLWGDLIERKNHGARDRPSYGSLKATRLPGRENTTYTHRAQVLDRGSPINMFLI